MRQKMPANVWSTLNTCMDDATYQIQRRNQTDTAKTDAWISQQHITAQQFGDVDVLMAFPQYRRHFS
jgi:hypothetical protein